MSRSELVRRYGIFTSGVIFAALGIALITRAGLGTSAVSGSRFGRIVGRRVQSDFPRTLLWYLQFYL